MKNIKKIRTNILIFIILLSHAPLSHAVNWLMLQGTEPASVTHRVFLFAQPSYTRDLSSELSLGPNAGVRALPATVAPHFDDDSVFHLRRARAGVRGNFTGKWQNDVTRKMNYFCIVRICP